VPGKTTVEHGVTIRGPVNLPATMPVHASQMYSRNVVNFMKHVYQPDERSPDFEDEITGACCIAREGRITNDLVRQSVAG